MQKIGAKIVIIGAMCLLFAVGMFFLRGLVHERQAYHKDVIDDIKSSYVGEQILVTPFLLVEHDDTQSYIFAQNSDISTQALVRDDEYERGIYQAVSFRSKVAVHQTFSPKNATVHIPDEPKDTASPAPVLDDADAASHHVPPVLLTPSKPTPHKPSGHPLKLIIAMSDLRGVTPTDVVVNGEKYPAKFSSDGALQLSYLQVDLPISEREFLEGQPLDVRFTLDVAGIGGFGVMPVGQDVKVSLSSNWQNPKFTGIALPAQKSFTKDGFSATWHSPMLSQQNQSKLVQMGANSMSDVSQYSHLALMSEFVQTGDTYTLTDRSIKYVLLIIMVSFGTFFLFEVIKARPIHPVQYLLVASALLVFYLLLLSLAEQIAFLYAYVIASIACVSLIGWYACYMLGSALRGVAFGVVLGLLYIALYVIMSANGLNLLLGSVFCFVFIAVVMVATRHVDWYGVGATNKPDVLNQSAPALQGERDE